MQILREWQSSTGEMKEVLEPMMQAVERENPNNKLEFMLEYLVERYGERATQGDKQNLEALRNEFKRVASKYKDQNGINHEDDTK